MRDSLVIGQEPELLRSGNTYTTFQRIGGDNLRNYGSIIFSAQMTPEFGLETGYANTYVSYADNLTRNPDGTFRISNAGLLDSLDHLAHIDGRYQIQPQTIGVVGFQYRETDYIGDQQLNQNPVVVSDQRNARSYYGYAGLDHNFRRDLTGSIRAGGRYTDYYNDPANQNTGSPYAMASLQYSYAQGSYIQLGGSYDYSASSQFRIDQSGNLTLNTESGTVFGAVHHQITPKLYGSILAQYQNSTYYGGFYDNKVDQFITVGLNLQYRFTPNFSAEVGYNYDKLDGEVNPSYDRNRIYIGITGSY